MGLRAGWGILFYSEDLKSIETSENMWTTRNQRITERISGISGDLESSLRNIAWDIDMTDDYSRRQTNEQAQSQLTNALGVYAMTDKGIQNLSKLKDTTEVKALFAHAGGIPWSISENGSYIMSMQQWIDRNNSTYDTLFIEACNTSKQMPIFRGTPMLYIEGIAGTPGLHEPKIIDRSNRIRAWFHNLKNTCRTHQYWGGEIVYRFGTRA